MSVGGGAEQRQGQRLLPLDQRQPKVTIPEEEELKDQRKRWGETCAVTEIIRAFVPIHHLKVGFW